MTKRQGSPDKISIYIPQKKAQQNVIERLRRLAEKKDRSINYLVVEAILQYLEREEKKEREKTS